MTAQQAMANSLIVENRQRDAAFAASKQANSADPVASKQEQAKRLADEARRQIEAQERTQSRTL